MCTAVNWTQMPAILQGQRMLVCPGSMEKYETYGILCHTRAKRKEDEKREATLRSRALSTSGGEN